MHGRHVNDKKDKFSLFRCADCGCIFLGDISVDQDYYAKYYKEDYYLADKDTGITDKTWSFIYKLFFDKKEDLILNYFKNRNNKLSILDVGCGNGNFLSSLNPAIFEKNGLEINPQGIKICEEKGIKIYKKSIESEDFGEKKFDVITLWHVLEHMENPTVLLKKVREILKDDGVLIIQVPNNESMGFKFGKENWFHLDSPRHLILPNRRTIRKACKNYGLKIIRIKNEFYDYPLDLFWSVRKSWTKFMIYPLYPIFKFFSKEHLTYIINKKNE